MEGEDRGCQYLSREPRMSGLGGFWIAAGLGIKEDKTVAARAGGVCEEGHSCKYLEEAMVKKGVTNGF